MSTAAHHEDSLGFNEAGEGLLQRPNAAPPTALVGHLGMSLEQLRVRARKHVDEVRALVMSCYTPGSIVCFFSLILTRLQCIVVQAIRQIPLERK
jgi:hypothetical protein